MSGDSQDRVTTLFSLVTQDPFYLEHVQLPGLPSAAGTSTDSVHQRLNRVLGHPPPPLPHDQGFLQFVTSLDCTRITNRLIASGLPWTHPSDRRSHRNNLYDLANFLRIRYQNNFMIWNLADDSAQGQYDTAPFYHQVVAFSMSKAYQMSIKTLFDICRSIHAWLALDSRNVAVIHCTNGVGRTGVALACYLRFSKIFDDTQKAFEYFQQRRTPNDHSWITKSHSRYVQYFNNIVLLDGIPPNPFPLKLHSILLNGVPNFDGHGKCSPGIEIYEGGNLIYSCVIQPLAHHAQASRTAPIYIDNNAVIFRIVSTSTSDPLILSSDVQIRLFHCPDPINNPTQVVTMVNFSFHTGFMSSGLIRVAERDLDLSRRDIEDRKFLPGFGMDMVFSDFKGEQDDLRALSYEKYLDRSMSKCLLRLVNHHIVKIDENAARTLLKNQSFAKLMVCFALQYNNNNVQAANDFLLGQTSGDDRFQRSRVDVEAPQRSNSVSSSNVYPNQSALPRSGSPIQSDRSSISSLSSHTRHSASSMSGQPVIPRRTVLPNEKGQYVSQPTYYAPSGLRDSQSAAPSLPDHHRYSNSSVSSEAHLQFRPPVISPSGLPAGSPQRMPYAPIGHTPHQGYNYNQGVPSSAAHQEHYIPTRRHFGGPPQESALPPPRQNRNTPSMVSTTSTSSSSSSISTSMKRLEELLALQKAGIARVSSIPPVVTGRRAESVEFRPDSYNHSLPSSPIQYSPSRDSSVPTQAKEIPLETSRLDSDPGHAKAPYQAELEGVLGKLKSRKADNEQPGASDVGREGAMSPRSSSVQYDAGALDELMSELKAAAEHDDNNDYPFYNHELPVQTDLSDIQSGVQFMTPPTAESQPVVSSSGHPSNPVKLVQPPESKPTSHMEPGVKKFDELFTPADLLNQHLERAMSIKSKYTHILDLKRSNNIAIILSKFARKGQSNRMLIHAVVGLEQGLFTLDDLKAIKSILPTRKERAILNVYLARKLQNATEFSSHPPLAPSEMFLAECLKQKDLSHMLDLFIVYMQIKEEGELVRSRVQKMKNMCAEIKKSDKFKVLLRFVFQLGSITNEQYSVGSSGGSVNPSFKPWMGKDARSLGYKISGLARIKDIRSADGRWSLMSFLVDAISRSRPEVLLLAADFKDLKAVKCFDTQGMVEELLAFESVLTAMREYPFNDRDHEEIAEPYLKEIQVLLTSLREELFQLEEIWTETATYLGEEMDHYVPLMASARGLDVSALVQSRSVPLKFPMDMFATLDDFMSPFDAEAQLLRERQEREQNRVMREKRKWESRESVAEPDSDSD